MASVQTKAAPLGTVRKFVSQQYLNDYKTNTLDPAYRHPSTHPASMITFTDGKTFQQKLDDGSLRGQPGTPGTNGSPGAKGEKGDAGPAGPNQISPSTTTTGFSNGFFLFNQNGKVAGKAITPQSIGALPTAGGGRVEGSISLQGIVVDNNHSLYGKSTTGQNINLIGVDNEDKMYLGWGGETQIKVRNELLCQHQLFLDSHENTRRCLVGNYGNGENSYIELAIGDGTGKSYMWDRSLKVFGTGVVTGSCLDFKEVIVANNMGIKGKTTTGNSIYMLYTGGDNNIHLGSSANSYIHMDNTTRFYHDAVFMNGASVVRRANGVRTAIWAQYNNPDRLELFWSQSPDGEDWTWGQKIYFDYNGTVFGQMLSIKDLKLKADGSTLECVRPDGAEYAQVTARCLNLGPYKGATKKLWIEEHAPGNPSYGDVWIQI